MKLHPAERVRVPAAPGLAKIQPRYSLEHAAWLTHPALAGREIGAFWLRLRFSLTETRFTTLHTSGDERYFLWMDGALLSRGPDRSDPAHWSFASYALQIDPGAHELRALVVFLGQSAPLAQMSSGPGFVLAADGLEHLLNTGDGEWEVADYGELTLLPPLENTFHVSGPGFVLEASRWSGPFDWVKPDAARVRWHGFGTIQNGHRLHPSPLPEQLWRERSLPAARASRKERPIAAAWADRLEATLVFDPGDSMQECVVPAGVRIQWLFDLGDYCCGYPLVTLSGSGELEWSWEESLYGDITPSVRAKGNRDQVEGKQFRGFGDRFVVQDSPETTMHPFWWRAGRFLVITVRTSDAPMRIHCLRLAETRYPVEVRPLIYLPDARLQRALPLLCRGLETGLHETFLDCPFYEQLMYAGDARQSALCLYQSVLDDRPQRRAIDLFDWSRWKCGWPASRYPSERIQIIPAFALMWILMVRDHVWWRGDLVDLLRWMPGLRIAADLWLGLADEQGVVTHTPGWSYLDKIPEWHKGQPPGHDSGGAASFTLLLCLALESLADLETIVGEDGRARVWRGWVERCRAGVRARYLDSKRKLFWDDPARSSISQHAQALGLLCGAFTPAEVPHAVQSLANDPDLTQANLFFRFYVHEAYAIAGQAWRILPDLDYWSRLPERGFKTPPEHAHEDCRSDCHPWSSHPLFHLHASIAGIRPAEPFFRSVQIHPDLGDLGWIDCSTLHPRGEIRLRLEKIADDRIEGEVTLPEGVGGQLCLRGGTVRLVPGVQTVKSKAPAANIPWLRKVSVPSGP